MSLEQICVGFSICFSIVVIAIVGSFLLGSLGDEPEEGAFIVVVIESMVLGVLLTYILYTGGILK